MVNTSFNLIEYKHPNKTAAQQFEHLVGIDEHKAALLQTLDMLLNEEKVKAWHKKHHKGKLNMVGQLVQADPLVILSGEVGCGKTALAQSVATPFAEQIGTNIRVFETPSNIRGGGLVGEISSRITDAFSYVTMQTKHNEISLLIIDEADDLATSREQNQAHHEDRAGLNVLIKQLDMLKKNEKRICVIMITNRIDVIDPAVRRRCSLHLTFERPSGERLKGLIVSILEGIDYKDTELSKLIQACEAPATRYSSSDIVHRICKQAVYDAISKDEPLTVSLITKRVKLTEPTPMLQKATVQ
jgi:SpoVK/Ycf46/Vps4 family AAA+-type ATPase